MAETWELRARFSRSLSRMYAAEVPAYSTLVEVTNLVNQDFARAHPEQAERLGSTARVSAERHGAIRVGTPDELAQVTAIFAAFGMLPVGFYDLREATTPVPVVSTAFRPTDPGELARNPFRVFTSMLATGDRRFFDPDLAGRIDRFLARRSLFAPELLERARKAIRDRGATEADASRLVELATTAFELSTAAIDHAWYAELAAISDVAADIAGVDSTHINHLTPRVLDIDELYRRMTDRKIAMIDRIQGPPRLVGPDVLLRQTSFRALAEPRRFRHPDGSVRAGSLRVRFGEVEARGVALTPKGRARYDELVADNADHATWNRNFPSESALAENELAYFTYRPARGKLVAEPIVYEDFLPASAAGIFQSNLTSTGRSRVDVGESPDYSREWLSAAIGFDVADPFELYRSQQEATRRAATKQLGRSSVDTR
ncbi:VOC family protein [Antrihabitans sp. YC2-6]|uniref:2-oxoadipate dioxygenase/decarboxylase n=1 Tax=Antrihabitans sp. YC2-6 TaxID=2799498 RepID=UPI0018F3859A|nr:VOC family protein [Antrihabitans sp. YC2-6]MBJ8347351.1 VOC family protein [Antrihabitans sp. YC2-6]